MTTKTHTFSYHDEPEGSFLKWALVTFPSESELGPAAFIDELADRSDKLQNIELQITLNGIEVNAKAFMDRIDEAMNWAVERAVKRKLEDLTGFDELHDSISEFEQGFKERVRKLAADNGIVMEDERW